MPRKPKNKPKKPSEPKKQQKDITEITTELSKCVISTEKGSTSSGAEIASEESSTSLLSTIPSEKFSTSSVAIVPTEESSTSSVAAFSTGESTTSSVATVPTKESSTTSVATISTEESATSLVATVPCEESSTSLIATIPTEESSGSSVATVPIKERSTSIVATIPTEESSTKLVATVPTKESSTDSFATIPTEESSTSLGVTILSNEIDPQLLVKWPKLKLKVPPIFLHTVVDFEQYVKKILTLGIKLYKPHRGKNYIKIICESFKDHKYLLQFLDKKQIPYHTFSIPSKRKMKVVIRGLPSTIDVNVIKKELVSFSIPVIRAHKMISQDTRKESNILILIVIPYDDKGKILLKVTQLLGYKVTLEPPNNKPRQCYRCQKWGHSQRYCHGVIKCVKCSGEHWSKKCAKTADKEPKCTNCGDAHTASYRKCVFAPGSEQYQMMQELKVDVPCYKPRELVTMKNYEKLYRNVEYSN